MSIMSDETMLKVIRKKAQARDQKDYNKHSFLQLIVETAMKREKLDINTPNHIDHKLQKKIDEMRKRRGPILVNPQQSKKPRFSSSCQLLLMDKEAYFKEVVEVEEKKVVLVSKDVDEDEDDDYEYEKEVMKEKKNNGKKTTKITKLLKNRKVHIPSPPPNVEVCNLMLQRIMEVGGTNPIWLTSKKINDSDMRSNLGRLFIPKCDALENYLTKEEIDITKDKTKLGLPCNVVDQNGARWNLRLRFWYGVNVYIITNTPVWNQVVEHFSLSLETPGKIELWCFRSPQENMSFRIAMRITRL